MKKVAFGAPVRKSAPERWGCKNLDAAPILADPAAVVHSYGPGGDMPEHTAEEAILCLCIEGSGMVKVGDQVSELASEQAVVWPAGVAHKVWTTDSSMTVVLIHFPGRTDLETRGPQRSIAE